MHVLGKEREAWNHDVGYDQKNDRAHVEHLGPVSIMDVVVICVRGFDVGKLVDVYREGRGNVALSPFENAPHMTKEAYERASIYSRK